MEHLSMIHIHTLSSRRTAQQLPKNSFEITRYITVYLKICTTPRMAVYHGRNINAFEIIADIVVIINDKRGAKIGD